MMYFIMIELNAFFKKSRIYRVRVRVTLRVTLTLTLTLFFGHFSMKKEHPAVAMLLLAFHKSHAPGIFQSSVLAHEETVIFYRSHHTWIVNSLYLPEPKENL